MAGAHALFILEMLLPLTIEMSARAMRVEMNDGRPRDNGMRIADLRPQRIVSRIELLVIRRYPRRQVHSPRYTGPVAAAAARDETGIVGLVLWGEQVDQVRSGDVIVIENGWCRERSGELVISTGRTGKLSHVEI